MYQLKAQIKKLDKVGMLFILPSLLIVVTNISRYL